MTNLYDGHKGQRVNANLWHPFPNIQSSNSDSFKESDGSIINSLKILANNSDLS